ncbi:TPA: hypothetical protein CPT87_06205 [Candidatus Gastranaerophilales bacterium HUM_5]|nr:MAG TPA: hypothetical protein CPT99_10865 [Candidatus Gastranaerophilales bacterium HUM_4]DAA90804.1 MAG TPA: hypothetical protein CPT87_06205 [Candidatus Gastranaerophilales bacterium HUM_5]
MQIQYNNQNFQALHASPKTLKRLGTTKEALLKNASIKDCIDRAEVTLKSKRHYDFKKFDWDDFKSISTLTGVAGEVVCLAGLLIGGLLNALSLAGANAPLWGFAAGCGIPVLSIASYLISRIVPRIRYTGEIQAGDRIENNKLVGRVTKQYEFYEKDNYKLAEELMKKGNNDFRMVVTKYTIDTPKGILSILNDDKIKENFTNGDCFNYKINEQGDTLLTKFFDIIPDETNQNEYNQILDKMKNMKGIIYNQKDSFGISVLEKILNAENFAALEIVKDYKFPYSEELDDACNNIADKNFKNKALNLNFSFPQIENVLSKGGYLDKVLQKLSASPFFNANKDKLSKEILEYTDNWNKSYRSEFLFPVLLKHGMLPNEEIDARIEELKNAETEQRLREASNFGFYS